MASSTCDRSIRWSPQAVVAIAIGRRLAAQLQRIRRRDCQGWRRFAVTRQDVQDHAGGMDVVRQGLGAGGFDGVQAIGEHGTEDVNYLPITAGLSFELTLHTAQGRWQIPVLERRPVAQRAGFAGQDRDVMERVVDRLAAAEGTIMASDNLTILPAFQPVGIGAYLDRTADRAGVD